MEKETLSTPNSLFLSYRRLSSPIHGGHFRKIWANKTAELICIPPSQWPRTQIIIKLQENQHKYHFTVINRFEYAMKLKLRIARPIFVAWLFRKSKEQQGERNKLWGKKWEIAQNKNEKKRLRNNRKANVKKGNNRSRKTSRERKWKWIKDLLWCVEMNVTRCEEVRC